MSEYACTILMARAHLGKETRRSVQSAQSRRSLGEGTKRENRAAVPQVVFCDERRSEAVLLGALHYQLEHLGSKDERRRRDTALERSAHKCAAQILLAVLVTAQALIGYAGANRTVPPLKGNYGLDTNWRYLVEYAV